MREKKIEVFMKSISENIFLRLISWTIITCYFSVPLYAQKDTLGRGVDILSSFRPIIRPAAKVQFSPGAVSPDTSRPVLNYSVPNQQIPLGYTITSLRPLAYSVDSVQAFTAHPYLKMGYGNLRTPYLKGSYSMGDGYAKGVQLTADHISSRAKLENQRYSSTHASVRGFKRWLPASLLGEGKLDVAIDKFNKYGYHFANPLPIEIPANDSIQQRFFTLLASAAISSTQPTQFGITYAANMDASLYTDRVGNRETGFKLNAPLQKYIGNSWRVDLQLNTDWSQLSFKGGGSISNTITSLSPMVYHWNKNFVVQAGVRPSWDPNGFQLFPVLNATIQGGDKKWALQLGWEGQLEKNSYRSLATVNPWLWVPGKLLNTSIDEKYVGIKANFGNHFYLNARSGISLIKNMPLFINDSSFLGDGKSFEVVYEERMRRFQLRGEVGYQVAERFQVGASLVINQFTGLRSQAHAWGVLPMEFNANVKVNILKDLLLKADLFSWRGARYLLKDGQNKRLPGAFDLNAGLEFKLTKSLSFWAQFNNLFNNTYQRWNQYPVYGFNCTAGVVFSPSQKKKN
jgi:hypothetical protein